jgi:acetylornithine deacetylase
MEYMNEQIGSQIIGAIDERRDEVINFLQKLVQFNSVTGNEGYIQSFIAETLHNMNLEVDVFEPDPEVLRNYPGFLKPDLGFTGRPNVVGLWHGSGNGRSLILNGHVDTVPIEPQEKWLSNPLSGTTQEGRIAGRGSSDMKSGLAAMTMAVAILQSLNLQPRGDVILEFTVDEERTGLGTLACVHRGYKADAGICCETSDLEIMPACIGRMWFSVHLHGKPTGIAARWEGVSAIDKGIKIVDAIYDLEQMRIADLTHPLYPDNRGALPCAITMFHSGTYPSITPEEATLSGSMGLMPYEDPVEVEKQLKAQIQRVAEADPWLRNNPPSVSTEGGYVAAGAEISTDHPIVATLQQAYSFVTGDPPILGGRMGAADTRFLIHQGKTPTVIFGPGVTAQMHAVDEFVPVDNLLTATKVIALAIQTWCNQDR